MGAIEDKIKAMGHTLPEPFKFPKRNRTGCVVVGSIVFVSGHGRYNGPTPGIKTVGKLGRDLTIEEGYATARLAALSILSSLKQELGELERIKRIVRLMGMVNVDTGIRPDAGGDRRRVGFLLRAAGTEERPARAHGRRALPNSRTAFRSRSTGNLSCIREREVLGQALQRVILTRGGLLPLPDGRLGKKITLRRTHHLAINASRYHRFARQ